MSRFHSGFFVSIFWFYVAIIRLALAYCPYVVHNLRYKIIFT
ncbi:hypothetical protein GMES_0039 [Paraglaciecola mesophila KMM 241]|uniref:Uncharacterized protein n=1 Tax=Paraglaciecola mesophila KMM 241 TaxID=1128912 RepID=K6ZG34_9ALTE|nr:hypothetical protein GMES_0039 [Paraglaciecola mesophila KMM 241]